LKNIIHFSHANGFPASTYRTIFAELSDHYEVRAIERIAHDPRFPVTQDWPHLVEQLLDDVGRTYEEPVWLVGHSLGGYLSLMAALKKPQWVRGVVMLDSPVVAGWRSSILRVSQWTGLDERLSPAAATRTRRTHWASRDEAWRHFHAKPAFARWDERMLSDYIDFGIPQVSHDGTRSLAFDRRIEYQIYRTLPHTLGARLARGAHRMDRGQPSVSDGKADRNGARRAADAARTEAALLRRRASITVELRCTCARRGRSHFARLGPCFTV